MGFVETSIYILNVLMILIGLYLIFLYLKSKDFQTYSTFNILIMSLTILLDNIVRIIPLKSAPDFFHYLQAFLLVLCDKMILSFLSMQIVVIYIAIIWMETYYKNEKKIFIIGTIICFAISAIITTLFVFIPEKLYEDDHTTYYYCDDWNGKRIIDVTYIGILMSANDVKKNKTFVSQIDVMIAQKQQIEDQERRLRGIEGINKAIEAMGNAQGGLDDRIAGYDYEKDELRRIFINPLAQSQKDSSVEVPPAVLLYGANGTGKTTFLNGIATEAKKEGYAEVITMPPVDDSEEFQKEIKKIFHDAKVRYLEPGDDNKPKRVRTVLLINDAERFFSMSYEQAKKVYGDLIDETDEARLKSANHDHTIIDTFKSALDDCSGTPENIEDKSLNNAATTIFITTNYPHLIDRDLLRKIDFFAVNPAKDKNMEEIMKFYFKKCSDVLDAIKDRAKDSDFSADDLQFVKKYISETSVQKLMQMAKNGTLNDLKIPYDTIPFENIARDFRPTTKTGAFDNKQLQQLSIQALNQYIQDSTQNYEEYYYTLLFNTKRMLDPVRYKHHVDIFNTLAPLNKQEEKEDEQKLLEEKIILYRMEHARILSDKDKKKLDYIKAQDSQELNYLQTKQEEVPLSDEEQARLDRILEEQRIIQEELANLDNLSNYEDDEDF